MPEISDLLISGIFTEGYIFNLCYHFSAKRRFVFAKFQFLKELVPLLEELFVNRNSSVRFKKKPTLISI